MLSAALVACFLLIALYLARATHEDAEKILQTAQRDIRRAHAILSAIPQKTPAVDRAVALLNRWV